MGFMRRCPRILILWLMVSNTFRSLLRMEPSRLFWYVIRCWERRACKRESNMYVDDSLAAWLDRVNWLRIFVIWEAMCLCWVKCMSVDSSWRMYVDLSVSDCISLLALLPFCVTQSVTSMDWRKKMIRVIRNNVLISCLFWCSFFSISFHILYIWMFCLLDWAMNQRRQIAISYEFFFARNHSIV